MGKKKNKYQVKCLSYFGATIQHCRELLVHLQVAKLHLDHHMCYNPT